MNTNELIDFITNDVLPEPPEEVRPVPEGMVYVGRFPELGVSVRGAYWGGVSKRWYRTTAKGCKFYRYAIVQEDLHRVLPALLWARMKERKPPSDVPITEADAPQRVSVIGEELAAEIGNKAPTDHDEKQAWRNVVCAVLASGRESNLAFHLADLVRFEEQRRFGGDE